MQLPDPVQTYFDADQRKDHDAFVAAFAADAVVRDEGNIYRGHSDIGAWWRAAKLKYDHHAVPFEAISEDGSLRVRATVTGNFPSSPATLTYSFGLSGHRITALAITA